jgi:hypothetical protein
MKGNNKHIEKEVEKTLDLLHEIRPVEANPLIYNKVIEKINTSKSEGNKVFGNLVHGYGYAFIAIILVFNLITSLYIFDQTELIEEQFLYQDFAQELNLNADIYYDSEL